jgi:hypothetical protein
LGEVAAAAAGIEAPSIVVVGEVVRFHATLDWVRNARHPRCRSRGGLSQPRLPVEHDTGSAGAQVLARFVANAVAEMLVEDGKGRAEKSDMV